MIGRPAGRSGGARGDGGAVGAGLGGDGRSWLAVVLNLGGGGGGGGGRGWKPGGAGAEEGAGGDAVDALEVAGQVALVAEPDLGGDFGDLGLGGEEEFAGAFDAAADEVLVGCGADGAFEEPGEMERAEAGDFGEGIQGDVLGEVFLDVIEDESEGASAEAAGFFADGLGCDGVMADEMDGEGVGEGFTVPSAAGVTRLDFGAEGEGQTADEGIVDGELGAELEAFRLDHLVGGADDESGVEGDDEEIAGVAVADGDGLEGGEEADAAGGDVEGLDLAVDLLFEACGAVQLDHDVVVERGFVVGIGGTAGELLDGEPGPWGFGTREHRGTGHVGPLPAGDGVHQTRLGEACGNRGLRQRGNGKISVRRDIGHRQALVYDFTATVQA